jgi:hypothetical protein
MKLRFSAPHHLRLKAVTQPWELQVNGPDQRKLVKFAEKLGFGTVPVPEHQVMPAGAYTETCGI